MKRYLFDVIVVGAGPGGVTAAGSLAGAGLSVLLIEAGVYAGAENWSGCVYFAESLAQADAFGEEAVHQAPFERRLVRRGLYFHNGLDLIGAAYEDEATFRHCYTVLRPVYDPYWASLAQAKGAMLLPQTTVTSLIRRNNRVVGVDTERGAFYAEVVFLAEGDASHLTRRERLERVPQPHFMQGVKAVMNLPAEVIEARFGLSPGKGSAHEYLIRNVSIGGRTALLHVGGFLYTNRDSLSLGYVIPLDHLRDQFRGEHDRLLEWIRVLPFFRESLEGARVSAYGAKLIRSGGVKEQPILVEDGLALGGTLAGLGVDFPYPNFTGPASASGLLFARAVRELKTSGKPLSAENLKEAYLIPLRDSVYGRNADDLAGWPDYLEQTRTLFGRAVDLVCGTARFMMTGGLIQTARFLRPHLSPGGLREMASDTLRAAGALGLGRALLQGLARKTVGSWFRNPFPRADSFHGTLTFTFLIEGQYRAIATLPWPVRGLLRRLGPGLSRAFEAIYSNHQKPFSERIQRAVASILQSLRVSDIITLPLFGLILCLLAMATVLWDLARFYILRRPVEEFLRDPAMAYAEKSRTSRDLDRVRVRDRLEMKLATNTTHAGEASHIRLLWPLPLRDHDRLARSSLWWICPARVYQYEAPPLGGRGKVTVNYENCIKCESCWRADESVVDWGRYTNHRLIYRPETAARESLLTSSSASGGSGGLSLPLPHPPRLIEWDLGPGTATDPASLERLNRALHAAQNAERALKTAIRELPPTVDATRRQWPLLIGRMLAGRLETLERALEQAHFDELTGEIREDRVDLESRLSSRDLIAALYTARRLRDGAMKTLEEYLAGHGSGPELAPRYIPVEDPFSTPLHSAMAEILPDRIVKEWENQSIPEEHVTRLREAILTYREERHALIRALSAISPALGLLAAHHAAALDWLTGAHRPPEVGTCGVEGEGLRVQETHEGIYLQGIIPLVPLALADKLLIRHRGRGYLVLLKSEGVVSRPNPAVGFRAAGWHEVELSVTLSAEAVLPVGEDAIPDAPSYLAIAFGAADYLTRRAKQYAKDRIQFPGQMQDTAGRDGIAKMGAVKAMIARLEAWHLLLRILAQRLKGHPDDRLLAELACNLAAQAFGPEKGAMGYDAGEVFGGMAYSEDDLLARAYRDSALFRYLAPGYGSAIRLQSQLSTLNSNPPTPNIDWPVSFDTARGQPLGEAVTRWHQAAEEWGRLSGNGDPHRRGEAAALLLGVRMVLCVVQQRLETGRPVEGQAAACSVLMGLAEEAVARLAAVSGMHEPAPPAFFPDAPPLEAIRPDRPERIDQTYQDLCQARKEPYRSGGFLKVAFDTSPRYLPEIQLHDPQLRARWKDCTDWFLTHFWERTFEGLHCERYIDRLHAVPPEVLEAFKRKRFFSIIIPKQEGGEGWPKVEYYILTTTAVRFGDAALCLHISASTSIGTTPVLLGLRQELPLVKRELGPLVHDRVALAEIGKRLDRMIRSLARPNPAWLRREFEATAALVEERIRSSRVAKYLAANFLKAFYQAGLAGQRGDLKGFSEDLVCARELFGHLAPAIRETIEELPRRERAHRLYLRFLSHGGVAAFALTEPTAGSDSGGVKTTARLRRVMLTAVADGRYRFELREGDASSQRYLIDTDRITFTEEGSAYLVQDGASATALPIRMDEYEYATDRGLRYYVYQGEKRYFHDMAQVRHTTEGPVYEYYALNGTKMWITNGCVATQFSLFARSAEGITGFMVDRHAEGLTVGPDERKMGQRGSPANELTLDEVRVPKECVIGYPGHGQINALETLNVGRCSLAMTAITLSRKLISECLEEIPESPERDRLLSEAAAILFGSESLAYFLVGLFDQAHESVRIESAIAKFICSEDLHDVISLVERAYGPPGQTERYRVEKSRRDARVLNIYEGTNEVQRFLIVKELITQARTWPRIDVPTDADSLDTSERPKAIETPHSVSQGLARWKEILRRDVTEAEDLLGETVWMDAVLQPTFFPLAEMAGEILRLDCIHYRIGWLLDHRAVLGAPYADRMVATGRHAFVRSERRLAAIDQQYRLGLARVRENLYRPEVVAADVAFEAMERPVSPHAIPEGRLRKPFRILCLVRAVADLSPRPQLRNGDLLETVWRLNPSDESALHQALWISRQSAGTPVTVELVMAGEKKQEPLLRWALAAGADRAIRIEALPTAGGSIWLEALEQMGSSFDLILTGAESEDGGTPLGPYIAGGLHRPFYRMDLLQVIPDGQGLQKDGTPMDLPAVVAVSALVPPPPSTAEDCIEAQIQSVPVISVRSSREITRFSLAEPTIFTEETITDIPRAAAYLREFAQAGRELESAPYMDSLPIGNWPGYPAVWSLMEGSDSKNLLPALRGAVQLAQRMHREACGLLLGPEAVWPDLIGLARAQGLKAVYSLMSPPGMLTAPGRLRLLEILLAEWIRPAVVATPAWEEGFIRLAGVRGPAWQALSGITALVDHDRLALSSPAYQGKLRRLTATDTDSALLLTIPPTGEFPGGSPVSDFSAWRMDLPLLPDWFEPLPPLPPETLASAEVIVDVGYGIRDGRGLQLAQDLKAAMERLGLRVHLGATRKVTQDLKLLPVETQIGQTGIRVNPRLILALGVSGAPQHMDYIGDRAVIFAFNKDPEAPLMTFNETCPAPKVHPIAGSLFETLPALIRELLK